MHTDSTGTRPHSRAHRRPLEALGSGLVGTLVLTGLHEGARRIVPRAPRMDVIGERALAGLFMAAGLRPPRGKRLFGETLAGELISNTLYYSLVRAGSRRLTLQRGLLLGLVAGIGAVVLPPRIGLGRSPGGKAPTTPLMTIAWYTAGGLAAAAAARMFGRSEVRRPEFS